MNKYIRKVNRRMRRRTIIIYFIIMMTMIFIIGFLLLKYKKDGARYSKEALENRMLLDQSISFKRGDILDRNGIVLAKSEVRFNVILDGVELNTELEREKKQLKEKFDKNNNLLTRTFDTLSKELEIDKKELENIFEKNKDSRYYILKKNVQNKKILNIKKRMNETTSIKKDKDGKTIKEDISITQFGIWFENKYKRVYPFNDLACSVIGFVNDVGDPLAGIEMEYNKELNGVNGRDFEYVDENLGVLRKKINPTNGKNVYLTIDIGIQKIITDKVKSYINEKKPKDMAILVMDPSNGEFLGMTSTPFYDLNNPSEHSTIVIPDKIVEENGKKVVKKRKWEDLSEKEQAELLQKKWQNYVVSHPFEPGSTFKPITMAIGLELNKFASDTTYYCDGGQQIDDYYIYCFNHDGHGTITTAQAIQYSCNDALMQMVNKIGAKDFINYQEIFNFGKKTGIDLPEEIGTKSMIKEYKKLLPVDLATNSFGQNFEVNMLNIACANAAIGNNGKYFRPFVAKEIKDENGNITKKTFPYPIKEVVSKRVAHETKVAMRMVIEESSYKDISIIKGYEKQLFGKSGTAEKLPRSEGKYISSFIEMAPFDNPKLLVYVVIDEGDKDRATYDARKLCADITKEILPMLNIPKQN